MSKKADAAIGAIIASLVVAPIKLVTWVMLSLAERKRKKADAFKLEETALEPPATPAKARTTWEESAAAVGALVEPAQKPTLKAISLSPNTKAVRRRRAPSAPKSFPDNPLHIPPEDLHKFFAQDPGNVGKHQAAEATAKRLGMVDGRHFSSYLPDVKSLISSHDYDAAIGLLLRIVEASERQSDYAMSYMPPAWHGLLADAYIKAGRRDLAEAIGDRLVRKQKPIRRGR